MRGYMARKQHQPRYKGIAKINAIRHNMKQMEEIASQLKSERETMMKHMKDIDTQIDIAIKAIKVTHWLLRRLHDFINLFLILRRIRKSKQLKLMHFMTHS